MILAVKNIRPVITFGLGNEAVTAAVGSRLNIWLQQTYKTEEYSVSLVGYTPEDALTVVKVSNNQWQVTPGKVGTFQLYLNLSSLDKYIQKTSNTIILTVE